MITKQISEKRISTIIPWKVFRASFPIFPFRANTFSHFIAAWVMQEHNKLFCCIDLCVMQQFNSWTVISVRPNSRPFVFLSFLLVFFVSIWRLCPSVITFSDHVCIDIIDSYKRGVHAPQKRCKDESVCISDDRDHFKWITSKTLGL